jgi:hypothetical protein
LIQDNFSTKINKKSNLLKEKIKRKRSEKSKYWPEKLDDVRDRA